MEKGPTREKLGREELREAIPLLEALRYPGLAAGFETIPALSEALAELLAAVAYKEGLSSLWAVLLGGTGTGKSSIFNALCGAPISASGVERPKTSGAIGYIHHKEDIVEGFPFPSIEPVQIRRDELHGPVSGLRGRFLAVGHSDEGLRGLVLVDTPDLDSLEPENRMTAEKFSILADTVIFVTSQEKYADEAPYLFLKRETELGKSCFLIVNKVSEDIAPEDILRTLGLKDVKGDNINLILIPHLASDPSIGLAGQESLKGLRRFLLKISSPEQRPLNLSRSRQLNRAKAAGDLARLSELLSLELRAADEWKARLRQLSSKAIEELTALEETRFASEGRKYIKNQIRTLFDRYDLLGGPRRFVGGLLLFPLKMLGVVKDRVKGSREEILERMKRRGPSAHLRETVERINAEVLTDLPPSDEASPLYSALRRKGLRLEQEEIEEMVSLQNQRLLNWLEDAFSRLSEGLPGSKKWGIYTTSLLWGIMILALETVVGGGFTVLDAILGSALAPFVTKGAVELFATREIRKITGELASLHRQGLVSMVEEQARRYERCIDELLPSPQALEAAARLKDMLSQGT